MGVFIPPMWMLACVLTMVWLEHWLADMVPPKRRRAARRPAAAAPYPNGYYANGTYLTPGTKVSLTIVQFTAVMVIVALAVGGYWWLESGVATAATKVDSFSTKLEAAVKTNIDQFKDQDNKRDQLGKDFIASQQQIVAKVSELNTAVTVQQHDTKIIADTLSKISDQLSAVTIAPARCVGPRC